MEKEGVVGLGVLDQPVHGAQDVGLGGLAHGVLLVIGEKDHVFAGIAEVLVQVGGHVLDVVDASAQLAFLTEVVDADQEGLSLPRAPRVLEVVALGRAMAERDGVGWGRRGTAVATLVRVVLLVGSGRAWTTGDDISDIGGRDSKRGEATYPAGTCDHHSAADRNRRGAADRDVSTVAFSHSVESLHVTYLIIRGRRLRIRLRRGLTVVGLLLTVGLAGITAAAAAVGRMMVMLHLRSGVGEVSDEEGERRKKVKKVKMEREDCLLIGLRIGIIIIRLRGVTGRTGIGGIIGHSGWRGKQVVASGTAA